MSQGGHLVKPNGARRIWAIMYRDTEGKLRWEGKFRTKSYAQARLSEVLKDRQRHLHATVISEFRTIRQGLARRASANPREHGSWL